MASRPIELDWRIGFQTRGIAKAQYGDGVKLDDNSELHRLESDGTSLRTADLRRIMPLLACSRMEMPASLGRMRNLGSPILEGSNLNLNNAGLIVVVRNVPAASRGLASTSPVNDR